MAFDAKHNSTGQIASYSNSDKNRITNSDKNQIGDSYNNPSVLSSRKLKDTQKKIRPLWRKDLSICLFSIPV